MWIQSMENRTTSQIMTKLNSRYRVETDIPYNDEDNSKSFAQSFARDQAWLNLKLYHATVQAFILRLPYPVVFGIRPSITSQCLRSFSAYCHAAVARSKTPSTITF